MNAIRRKHTIIIYALFILLSGCETPISLTIPNKENTKIIEGWIENDGTPVVIISRSLSYYSTINGESLLSSVDTNAIVKVSDDMGKTEQLIRGFSNDHFLGVLGKAYVGNGTVKGIPGHSYTLYVESDGNIYTAQTTIPLNTVQIDSFGLFRQFTDTTASLRVFFTDRANSYDCYRFFLMIKDLDLHYSQIFSGTFDDLTFNGLSASYEMMRSPQSNLSLSGQSKEERENYYRSTFRVGDTVYVKSTLTDKATQEYWFPLQTDISMGMNPFLTPGTYPTNIQGENVSGIWSGYHARYDTIRYNATTILGN
ncbi:MAG: DUF4249 domain-containing protein [Bacteroidales bacterium]|jgi:hypothetical protein|nr:DUF4249 domain-containing protein [Bacteroidales bacterium]